MSVREDVSTGHFDSRAFRELFAPPHVNVLFLVLLALTFALGIGLRMRAAFGDFPLFDGGMFYVMVGDLQQNGYRLPETVSYNGGSIPFSYPPFGFYLAALLEDALPFSRMTIMATLPAVASAATVGAVFILAGGILRSRWAALVATFAFAAMPESFSWMIVGGGLTRSLGFLFAVLALGQIYRMYTRPQRWYVASSMLFVALTVLSHLEMTMFLGFSAAVMFGFFGRSREGVTRSAVVVAGALLIASPWWLTLVSREGLAPWLNAGSSRGVLGVGALRVLSHMNLTAQAFIDMLGLLALFGIVVCLVRREFFLPCWLLAIALLMPWVFTRLASVPAALLVGYVLTAYVWPWLREGLPGMQIRRPPPAWLAPGLVAVLVLSGVMSGVTANRAVLVTVSDDARRAMLWVSQYTDESDRFLVVTGRPWYHDHAGEWFPAITERVSVATIQGTEWLGDFDRQVNHHRNLQDCIDKGEWCLAQWERSAKTGFTYVYVSKETPPELAGLDECCANLRRSLLQSTGYQVVYENGAAAIFMRQPEGRDDVRAGSSR